MISNGRNAHSHWSREAVIRLAGFLVALALIAQQGLETVLEGLLPIPALGRDGVVAPS